MSGRQLDIGPMGRSIADQIRERRQRWGMTFAELSRRLDQHDRPIAPLGLRRIEGYERRIDVDDLVAIAAVLDLDAAMMIEIATGL